jgi:hypothetical protein
MSVRRKLANLLEYFNPFSTMPPQQHEDTPAAKKPRLQTSTTRSRAAAAAADDDIVVDAHTTDTLPASPDGTVAVAPADTVTAAVSLPSARTSRGHRWSWKPEEDAKLTEAVNTVKDFGSNYWVRVAVLVPGRTNVQCRTRWVESLDPGINRGSWTEEEDETLTEAVTEHGTNSWVVVAALFPGRTNLQCRQRWVTSLH